MEKTCRPTKTVCYTTKPRPGAACRVKTNVHGQSGSWVNNSLNVENKNQRNMKGVTMMADWLTLTTAVITATGLARAL